jgi:hypothetical protein
VQQRLFADGIDPGQERAIDCSRSCTLIRAPCFHLPHRQPDAHRHPQSLYARVLLNDWLFAMRSGPSAGGWTLRAERDGTHGRRLQGRQQTRPGCDS